MYNIGDLLIGDLLIGDLLIGDLLIGDLLTSVFKVRGIFSKTLISSLYNLLTIILIIY